MVADWVIVPDAVVKWAVLSSAQPYWSMPVRPHHLLYQCSHVSLRDGIDGGTARVRLAWACSPSCCVWAPEIFPVFTAPCELSIENQIPVGLPIHQSCSDAPEGLLMRCQKGSCCLPRRVLRIANFPIGRALHH